MATRFAALILPVALALTAGAGPADPPTEPEKSGFSATVKALNVIFQRDPDGSVAKRYIGRKLTVSGTVKEVAASEGGQLLALNGLPATPEDPSGCTILFPVGHPSLEVVKGLAAGTTVRATLPQWRPSTPATATVYAATA